MRAFDRQLLRLKQALGLVEDQAVAAALGMSKAAFADRKRRDAFPVDKLKALAADRPDLRLDLRHILSDTSDELERRLAALATATKIAGFVDDEGARYEVQERAFMALVEHLDADEQRLVHCYRRADTKGKALLLATAVTLGGDDHASNKVQKNKRKGKSQ